MQLRDQASSHATRFAAQMAATLEGAIPVIALHCSGANGNQWRNLADQLGPEFALFAPSLIGTEDAGHWQGRHAFSLSDEAAPILELIDALSCPVHLIGHSYGGGVALKVASERLARIASLALYEPSAFHILRHARPVAKHDLAEIERLAGAVGNGLVTGAYEEAAEAFVDYWNGEGAWVSLRHASRDALVKWLPKAPLDFRALIADDTPWERLRRIACPVLLLCGEHAKSPSRRICVELDRNLTNGRMEVIEGAGHMGPLTHAAKVHARVEAHLRSQIFMRSAGPQSRAFAA